MGRYSKGHYRFPQFKPLISRALSIIDRCCTHQQYGPVLPCPIEDPEPHGGADANRQVLEHGVHVRRVEACSREAMMVEASQWRAERCW